MKTMPMPVACSINASDAEMAEMRRKTTTDPVSSVNVKFMPVEPMQSAANNRMLSGLNSGLAAECSEVVSMLYPIQDALLEWIRASEANAKDFFDDPVAVTTRLAGLTTEQVALLTQVSSEFPKLGGAQ
jgi:hypothetical protein